MLFIENLRRESEKSIDVYQKIILNVILFVGLTAKMSAKKASFGFGTDVDKLKVEN